ncbi:hypothetical protein ORV05_33215 [Amycolatopsis cynarae]|uniref:ABC transporter permease n=1 Tax=Amycolatopsis cynarae TaxID=2995223 RepID=A0ABY7B073_9PSEU|nr:hypothetical protein [Amycolatopsis sp. HUAS 11-8]WAL65680.1 hypothetical protein ORV05_33215 [Amycolatopsis sp. HUAS 11-8]
MSLLAAERVRLFSTPVTWWAAVLAVVASAGLGAARLIVEGDELPVTVGDTQTAETFGRTVILVMAVLAATVERRLTRQASPGRRRVLAGAAVVGGWSALVGLAAGFGSWALATVVDPEVDLGLHTAADWRAVLGQAALFALTALLGFGIGLLVRAPLPAVAIVLGWTQLVEGLAFLAPGVQRWLLFFAANQVAGWHPGLPLSAGWYGLYFAALCLLVFTAGVVRDKN